MKPLAIVCGSPSSEMLAPFTDDNYEIWALGNRSDRYDKECIDRLYEIHNNLDEHRDIRAYAKHLESFKQVVIGDNSPICGIKNGVVYPYEEVASLIGYDYLTSSSAYMLAHAILEGYTEIEIYGVDMAISDHEYFWQRPNMEFWAGYAMGRGINLKIPEVSPLCKSAYVEGRDWGTRTENGVFKDSEFEAMRAEHQKLINNIESESRKLELQRAKHEGAMQVYEHLKKVQRAQGTGQIFTTLLDTVNV